jgi:arginase
VEEVLIYQGRAGDRNPRGILGAKRVGSALAQRMNVSPVTIGRALAPLGGSWAEELSSARHDLTLLADHVSQSLANGKRPVTTMGRCAAALATLPVIARFHPDARIVWFDAQADSNTPDTSTSGYLGGMVLTGAAGMWETGLGGTLDLGRVILVGARDIDPPEQELIRSGRLQLIPPGTDCIRALSAALGKSPVYVHLDCDVLEPGIVPTEYRVPGGLNLQQLQLAFEALAERDVLGLEIAEFESSRDDCQGPESPEALLDAVQPVFNSQRRARRDTKTCSS